MQSSNFLHRRIAAAIIFVTYAVAIPSPGATRIGDLSPLGAAGTVNSATWLPLADVYRHLIAQGYRDVISIERHALGYEAIVSGSAQERIRLFVDPRSGRIVGARRFDKSSEGGIVR